MKEPIKKITENQLDVDGDFMGIYTFFFFCEEAINILLVHINLSQ